MRFSISALYLVLLVLPVVLSVDPCTSSQEYANWMGDISQTALTNFRNQRLNDILIGGSHDAGLNVITSKSILASVLPDSYFITQSRTIQQQLCTGARWFDVRFIWNGQKYVVFHGNSGINAYGQDLDTEIADLKAYLDEPRYKYEVVFWRIKVYDGNSTFFAETVLNGLKDYMVVKQNNISLEAMTLSDIYAQNNGKSHLVVLAYEWTPPVMQPVLGQGYFWDYKDSQEGQYSDAETMNGMIAKCEKGQQTRLTAFKTKYANVSADLRPILGMWWTFTGGDVMANTMKNWAYYPNGLNDFYYRNNGEIGNVLVVDFWGDYDQVMKIVKDYNTYKFNFPYQSPTTGRSLNNNPVLPGSGIMTDPSTCDNTGSDNATQALTNKIIGIGAGIGAGVLLLLILCIAACCCCCKKKGRSGRY
eukprot:TRINITY_DN1263_c0_g1_i1.p1 TRINITY_DN1263_c0_g1~~TRINITY_DN1263_c0_g1_i1.p1  ORF type:complete len:418 (+),score=85.79 TRINITY_DN1263_c0_g1_i1:75-1328(+)